jgi:hypothetical protein
MFSPLQTRSKETRDLPLMRLSDRSMMRHSPNQRLKMKNILTRLLACLFLVALAGCGKPASEQTQTPDPATQPEAQAALFQRTCDRVKGLIAAKDFDQARRTLELFKEYQLTPEQQQIVDKLKAQIPAN